MFSEDCLLQCCLDHGLPIECLEEEFETKQVSKVNGTHQVIRIVRSKKCATFSSVMKQCKKKCIGIFCKDGFDSKSKQLYSPY